MKDVITDDYKLLHGDCLERMKYIPDGSVDLILTDPPYNIARDNNFHTMGRKGIDFGEWDKGFDLFSYIDLLPRVCTKNANVVIFNDWKNIGEIAKYAESKGFVVLGNYFFIDEAYAVDFYNKAKNTNFYHFNEIVEANGGWENSNSYYHKWD